MAYVAVIVIPDLDIVSSLCNCANEMSFLPNGIVHSLLRELL